MYRLLYVFIYRFIHLCFCARWHDAGTYDAKSKTGGPNGSIRNEEEFTHGANNGLKIALDFCGNIFSPFKSTGFWLFSFIRCVFIVLLSLMCCWFKLIGLTNVLAVYVCNFICMAFWNPLRIDCTSIITYWFVEFTLKTSLIIDFLIQKKFSKVKSYQNSVLQIRLLIFTFYYSHKIQTIRLCTWWKRYEGSDVEYVLIFHSISYSLKESWTVTPPLQALMESRGCYCLKDIVMCFR